MCDDPLEIPDVELPPDPEPIDDPGYDWDTWDHKDE